MPEQPSRLLIAQRIRQDLIQEIDHEILIERMLSDVRYARDVLLVCDALLGGDLPALANLFREASAHMPPPEPPPRPGRTQQANDWARDTSGFGLTQPPPMDTEPLLEPAPQQPERRRAWLDRFRRS